jgi:peptidyl-dipeptidase Dcp
MIRRFYPGLVLCLLVLGCARAPSSSTETGGAPVDRPPFHDSNPFSRPSVLLYEAPPLDRIRNEHYQPAIEEGMRRQRKEWDAIARQTEAPTFENTLVALERSGSLLSRSYKVFGAVVRANTNDTLQEVQTEIAPQLAAHFDALYLDPRLYRRVQQVYDRRASLGLSQEQRELVELYRRDFVRAGALLSADQKSRLRDLNQEEARLSTEFRTRLLAATTVGALVLDDRTQLEGLSEGEVAAAAEAARERGL